MTEQPITVWTEIPVTNMDKAMEFYRTVFGYQITLVEEGPNPTAILNDAMNTVGGHLYPGKPAAEGQGPTIHLEVSGTLESAIDRCWEAGGKVLGDPITIPPGRFVYAQDPDGNSIGLFKGN